MSDSRDAICLNRSERFYWRVRDASSGRYVMYACKCFRAPWVRVASSALLASNLFLFNISLPERALEATPIRGHFRQNILLRRSDGVRTMPVVIGASKRRPFL